MFSSASYPTHRQAQLVIPTLPLKRRRCWRAYVRMYSWLVLRLQPGLVRGRRLVLRSRTGLVRCRRLVLRSRPGLTRDRPLGTTLIFSATAWLRSRRCYLTVNVRTYVPEWETDTHQDVAITFGSRSEARSAFFKSSEARARPSSVRVRESSIERDSKDDRLRTQQRTRCRLMYTVT